MIKKLKINGIKALFTDSIFLFAISLILPENFRNIPLIIFSIVILACLFIQGKYKNNFFNKTLIINSLFFITMLISLFYTNDLDDGFKRITVMISLIIIPLSFYLINTRFVLDYNTILNRFYLLFFLSSIILIIGIVVQNYFNNHFNEFIFRDYSERINSKYGKYSMHPIYASLYLSISLVFSISIYKRLKKRSHKVSLLIGVLFLTFVLIVLARKGIIVITFLIFLFYFIRNQQKKNLIYFGLAGTILLIISYYIPEVRNRYIEFINAIVNNKVQSFGSTSLRLKIYECSIDLIRQSPFFGFGIGDVKNTLNTCYSQNTTVFKGDYFNSHNQFLSAWLSAGVVGIVSLLFMVVYNLKIAINRNDFTHIAVLILLSLTLMTENILERQNGVILFSFFINFFAFKNVQHKISN